MAFLQDYQSLGVIGRGAFATIYKVKHLDLGYVRALKVLKDDVVSEEDKAYRTFVKECRVLLKIGNGCHPNIVRIYQPRLVDNRAMVEMDYVNGCTLLEYLKDKKFMPIDEVLRMMEQIGGALAYCHHDIYLDQMSAQEDGLKRDPADARQFLIDDVKRSELIEKYQVIHNDLHSNNVMRRNYDGNFVLLDFGLSIQDHQAVKSSSRQGGAPEYKSPEKWDNENVETTQNDIYSFGILMYEALAGRVPFELDTVTYQSDELKALNTIRKQHCEQAPPPLEPLRRQAYLAAHPEAAAWSSDIPEWLEKMVMKCLAKNPSERYADAKELMEDFNRYRPRTWDNDDVFEVSEVNVEPVVVNGDGLATLQRENAALKKDIASRMAQLASMREQINTLESQMNSVNSGNANADIAVQAANERARRAELERNSLRTQVTDLERKLRDSRNNKKSESSTNSLMRLMLILLISTVLGILLGAMTYTFFMGG